jgi:hypothetical protein
MVNTIDNSNLVLDELINNARNAVIDSYQSNYGANVTYAKLLNQKWLGFDWFDLKHNDSSDEGKAVKAEGDKFRSGIKAWHKNPSVAWGQVRTHAKTDRYGKPVVDSVEGAEGEEGAEGSDNAKHNRSPELRNLEELVTLFKFNRRQESLSPKLQKVQAHIASALIEMGVDLNMIED